MLKDYKNFVFMKVGMHAGESFEDILARKMKEYKRTGMIFWGYGGAACHPMSQVQPFVKSVVEDGGNVHLLMEPINSKADPDLLPARQFSVDGQKWEDIPKGITVTGSKYAIVLGEIAPASFEIPFDPLEVAVGPSRGKSASDYIKGRTDKACLTYKASGAVSADGRKAKIGFTAPILDPFAVLLRGGD